MNIENAKAQMRKGFLEMITLLIISGKEAYPSDILKTLKENHLIVVEGTMYPLLTRMKNANYLGYNWQESLSGPPRKYYYITDEGRNFLNELLDDWRSLNNVVKSISDDSLQIEQK
ncbi:MAG: PadR family transcriptional regulator [Saprospiraceae bacterium]|jgi:PadR family transcriptional regulator, regulatory protein PadR|nr:PadR family transcriptional regulator [Saprospiraceae bacterium]